jgi:predicted dehydrogenase
MEPIKIAVVGPGLMGKRHIELLIDNKDCKLVALVAPDHAHHHQLASNLAVPLYHDVDALLAKENVDGVIIASPNIFHADQAVSCINANVPLLIEKPISHTYETGKKIAEIAENKFAKVLIGHHRAHSPILQKARDIIKSNQLGNIVGIMGSALFYKPVEYFEAGPWRKELGGGPILINLIHEVGNFRSLCGEIVAVQAMASNSTRNFSVEDTVVINFQFANGALGTFFLSDTAASAKSWEQTSQENKSYPSYSDEDCYHVVGTLGSLSIPTMRVKKYPTENESSWWKPFMTSTMEIERTDPLECQLAHFVEVIRGNKPSLVSAQDGLRNLEITEAIARSSKNKRLIAI